MNRFFSNILHLPVDAFQCKADNWCAQRTLRSKNHAVPVGCDLRTGLSRMYLFCLFFGALLFLAPAGAENITAPLIDPAAEKLVETLPDEPLPQVPVSPTGAQLGNPDEAPALFDIKEPIEIVDNTRNIIIIAAAILAALLVIALIVYLWKRSRKQKAILAHETALQQLRNAQQLIDDYQVDTFTTLIDQTLRNYIEQRFFIFARRQTTREFIGGLTDGNKPAPEALTENTDNLQTWLEHCDLVKFAKATLSRESMTEMVGNLRSFIESTKVQDKKQ